MSTVPEKPLYKSKVFWLNVITAAVGLAEALTPINIVSAPVLLGISVAGNTILRLFFTAQPLTTTPESKKVQ